MTHKFAVISAGIFHYCLRFVIFIAPYKSYCNGKIGGVASFLTLIGICLFLIDIEIYPLKYRHHNIVMFHMIETFLSLMAIEFSIIMIWGRIENALITLIKHILNRGDLYKEMGGDNFVSLIIGGLAVCFLLFSIKISNSSEAVSQVIVDMALLIKKYYQKIKSRSRVANPTSSSHHLHQYEPCHTTTTTATVHLHCPQISQNPIVRNPSCPIHGDHEINMNHSKSIRMRK